MQIKKIIFLAILLVTPLTINAASSINVICPEKVKDNTNFTCSVKGNFDKNVNNIIVKYRYSDELSYQSIELKDTWDFILQDNPSNTKIGLRNDFEIIGETNLADIIFKTQSGSINKNLYIEFYDFDGTNSSHQAINYSNDPIKKYIRVMSNNNNLKTLTIDGENIGLTENTNYSYNANKKNITISAELTDANASCENITRTVNLVNGNNIIEYNVIAEDGSIKKYTINVIYNEQKNNDSSYNTNTINNNTVQPDNNSNNNADNSPSDQTEENKVEETITDDTTKKEQKDKTEQKENTKDTKQVETTYSTNNNKKIISVILIIASVGIIGIAIVVAKKNWSTLYKK